jgi:hypothetical protein
VTLSPSYIQAEYPSALACPATPATVAVANIKAAVHKRENLKSIMKKFLLGKTILHLTKALATLLRT